MGKKMYCVQIAYESKENRGQNYQTIEATSRVDAVNKALQNMDGILCVVLSVKRIPRKISTLVIAHNVKVGGANE